MKEGYQELKEICEQHVIQIIIVSNFVFSFPVY